MKGEGGGRGKQKGKGALEARRLVSHAPTYVPWLEHALPAPPFSCLFPVGKCVGFLRMLYGTLVLQMAYVLNCPEEGKMGCGCGPV